MTINSIEKTEKIFLVHLAYDGLLLTIQNQDKIKKYCEKRNLPLLLLDWYPTVQFNPYRAVTPKYVGYIFCIWGDRRNGKYSFVLDQLQGSGDLHVYGNEGAKTQFPKAYRGFIPFDGQTLLDTLQRDGITLVLHSNMHLTQRMPSGRIFEAAAASTVIICDRHPFVMKHFGDAVLYFDHNQDSLTIFNQIKQHLDWIKNNPQPALEMAKKRTIFIWRSFF